MVIGDMIGSDAVNPQLGDGQDGSKATNMMPSASPRVVIDLNKDSQFKMVGLCNEDLKRMEAILGKYSTKEINTENQKYIDASFVEPD